MVDYNEYKTKGKMMDSMIAEIANVGLTLLFVGIALVIINWIREQD